MRRLIIALSIWATSSGARETERPILRERAVIGRRKAILLNEKDLVDREKNPLFRDWPYASIPPERSIRSAFK